MAKNDEITKAFLSFRVPLMQWLPDKRFDELLRDLGQYRQAADELALFSSFIHPVLPLETVKERMEVAGRRIAALKAKGCPAGINFLNTLGHCDEYLDDALQGEQYTRITGPDGKIAQGSFCPNCENFRGYVRQAYTFVAQADPAFIWLDDDIRMGNHGPVGNGCFCAHCVELFSRETGVEYTRESLVAAFDGGDRESRKNVRLAWMEHNAQSLERLLALIEESVHAVKPGMPLGLMTGEHLYERYDNRRSAAVLGGKDKAPVWWRPGGGFYADDCPGGMLDKAVLIARQISRLPGTVTDIQSEIENFPYQPLKKSAAVNALETAVYIAAGCTGAAYNVLGFNDEPLSDYGNLMARLTENRPFYDLLVRTLGRSEPRGVGNAWSPDLFAYSGLEEGKWFGGDADGLWPAYRNTLREIHQSGLPMSCAADAAEVWTLSGAMVPALDKAALERVLSGGVYIDGLALERLNRLGYGDLTGFELKAWFDKDCAEILVDDPLNGSGAGVRRDCVQAFWGGRCGSLEPARAGARTLARKIGRLATTPEFPVMGVFENRLGGRVAVAGYAPWTFLQTEAKNRQLKNLFRWLSHDQLSAYVSSYHRAALWARQTVDGQAAAVILNASLDPAVNLELMLRTPSDKAVAYGMDCRQLVLSAAGRDGVYARFVLPGVEPWRMAFVVAERSGL